MAPITKHRIKHSLQATHLCYFNYCNGVHKNQFVPLLEAKQQWVFILGKSSSCVFCWKCKSISAQVWQMPERAGWMAPDLRGFPWILVWVVWTGRRGGCCWLETMVSPCGSSATGSREECSGGEEKRRIEDKAGVILDSSYCQQKTKTMNVLSTSLYTCDLWLLAPIDWLCNSWNSGALFKSSTTIEFSGTEEFIWLLHILGKSTSALVVLVFSFVDNKKI